MLELGEPTPWRPPVLGVSALENHGVEQLMQALDEHRAWLLTSDEGQRRRTARSIERVRLIALQRIQGALLDELSSDDVLAMLADSAAPDAVVTTVLRHVANRLETE
jgi:LAO/AO transport system kinase